LFHEAKTGRTHQLNSVGTIVPGKPPFRPLPPGVGGFVFPPPAQPPIACIPGFMPGIAEVFRRFATRSWGELCAPAVQWAEEGHVVSSFEFGILENMKGSNTFFPSGREFFTPGGFTPSVGERFRSVSLARTIRNLAEQGPEYFIEGEWAQNFVKEANRLGWDINLQNMSAIPPRWVEPLRFKFRNYEVVQLAPPEMVGVFCSFFMGVMEELGVQNDIASDAQSFYYMAHTLRRVIWELGLLNDPLLFDNPLDVWLSKDYQQSVARIIKNSRPKIDLSEHVRLNSGNLALAAAGLPVQAPGDPPVPAGSCEISIVDSYGNWLEIMNTIQSGGIPGAVVDGVHMWGSHAFANMGSTIAGWFTGGGRNRCIIGHTMVFDNGKPWLTMGTPGEPVLTVPQVLWHILGLGMHPTKAADMPRMWPLMDDYSVAVEDRIEPQVIHDLTATGILVKSLCAYDFHFGSFQICWRDLETGLLNSCADPRRCGKAGGY
jgi:gamma-glutamyltranspeptidase / glutathione hydrolase